MNDRNRKKQLVNRRRERATNQGGTGVRREGGEI